ncbi:MAG TPA: type VI secretion system accessory protein TagJ [Blastocatellia bacterium]|jgi:type VI secretion system protein ImpE|nr:type VI secretion system accessory protein TagJ [Blastocatellia bacterium]
MATAKELFDTGNLRGAIDQVISEVKAAPTDMQRRTFLFELLCFAGEFDRAERQLDVIGHQSAKAEIGVQVYRNNMKAERDRRRLFSDGLQPHFLVEPPSYVDLHLDAINRLREGSLDEARAALDRAEEERPALSGRVNGDRFLDFRDYNDLLGPVLEVIMAGEYTWLPFEHIKQVVIDSPRQLRDLIWTAARVEATDGTMGEVFIPALYAGSSEHANDQVRLGRMTDWRQVSEDLYIPEGLRLFLVDNEDKPMLAVRSIEFDAAAVNTQSAPS